MLDRKTLADVRQLSPLKQSFFWKKQYEIAQKRLTQLEQSIKGEKLCETKEKPRST